MWSHSLFFLVQLSFEQFGFQIVTVRELVKLLGDSGRSLPRTSSNVHRVMSPYMLLIAFLDFACEVRGQDQADRSWKRRRTNAIRHTQHNKLSSVEFVAEVFGNLGILHVDSECCLFPQDVRFVEPSRDAFFNDVLFP
ncbi:hypothetical protein V1525DRAFT_411290 [Lipomyces kononenkoae]|uniref:Uncharacterized protein n=1 Tax=Lipomyces kononenkoae TaxID=34357 RepID=A0ACC3STP1_LIPKO